MIKKIHGSKNNPSELSTTKMSGPILCGYLLPTIRKFNHIENKHDVYKGEDCIKTFYESLREHAIIITDFEK